MALTRVKTANTTIPEVGEAAVVLLAMQGTDGKPYLVEVDPATGQIPVTASGTAAVTIRETYTRDYSSGNVTTGAWVQIIASTSAIVKDWDVFDSSGQIMELGAGGAGAEVRFALLAPGGGAPFQHQLAAGSRVSIRAVSANATTGNLVIQAWG